MKSGVTQFSELSSLFTSVEFGGTEKKEKKVIFLNTFENEIVLDPLFKKVRALKKILSKYSNKTFTEREKDEVANYEDMIKIEICKIFTYLLDMRQD